MERTWQYDGIRYAPDEQGSAVAADGQTQAESAERMPDTVDYKGETVNVQEALESHQNRKDWERTYKQRDQALAESRKSYDQALNKLIDKVATPAPEPKPEPEVDISSAEAAVAKMPDPVQDPEGFQKAQLNLLREHGKAVAKSVRETVLDEVKEDSAKVRSELTQAQTEQATKDIVKENLDMVDRYLDKHHADLSDEERSAVRSKVGNLTGKEYGDVVTLPGGKRVFRYNEKAVEDAAGLVPSVRKRNQTNIEAAAYRDGLAGRDRGQEAASPRDTSSSGPMPGANARIEDKIAWLQGQDEGTVLRELNRLSVEEQAQLVQSAAYGG